MMLLESDGMQVSCIESTVSFFGRVYSMYETMTGSPSVRKLYCQSCNMVPICTLVMAAWKAGIWSTDCGSLHST